jgi:nucleoside phosphorylase
MLRRLRREDYTVGCVCALPVELAAAKEMLDEKHEDAIRGVGDNDENVYCMGSIAGHNVVIVCLPSGHIGNNPAAAVATQMQAAFKGIRFSLMVGIGGGVPSTEADIRLGDVVVSQPLLTFGGVVQYDLGRRTPNQLERIGSLNSPPQILLSAVGTVQANAMLGESTLSGHLSTLERIRTFQRRSAGPDLLFKATYNHQHGATCDQCGAENQQPRPERESGAEVTVHYGTIASGNQVIKDAAKRDRISAELGGVLCFEMEAAGLMSSFPCLVIRGISDYADTHKNYKWQAHAAGTAAAYAKELLTVMPAAEVMNTRRAEEATNGAARSRQWIYDFAVEDAFDNGEDDTSFRDSAYGTMSETASVQAVMTLPGIREEMLDILTLDSSLKQSGQEALGSLSADVFFGKFKSMLKNFAQELKLEAKQKEERGAAFVFWYYATYAAKSTCEYWGGGEKSAMAELLAQLPEKKMQLDHALQQVAPHGVPEDKPDDEDGVTDEWEGHNPEDIQHLVHLKRLEHWIIGSKAFQNLRTNLQEYTRRNTSSAIRTNIDYEILSSTPLIPRMQDLCC